MRAPLLFAALLVTASGCAGRLSPHLDDSPAKSGLAVLECYYYPSDPEKVRSKFSAPDSFVARAAYLETFDGSRSFRGLSEYGTGYVIFTDVPPGTYRLTRIDMETKEYSEQLLRDLSLDVTFRIPPGTAGDTARIEIGRPVYLGRLAIRRAYKYEDVAHAPSQTARQEKGKVDMKLRALPEDEGRAWRKLLERKSYKRSLWGPAIEERLDEVERR